ncbi:MAG: hypothetical protein ACRD0Y_06535 [Terriglobales bacterium]
MFCLVLLSLCLGAQNLIRARSRTHAPVRFHGLASDVISTPQITALTASGFTVTWTTTQALTTQLHYGTQSLSQIQTDATVTKQHNVTITGLQPDTRYQVQAESSNGTLIDVLAPLQTVTTAPVAPAAPAAPAKLFPAAAAAWLYSAPTGTPIDISSLKMGFDLNTHDGGFDFPVEYTDGTHGCTTFTDTIEYNLQDKICVPNPAGGYHPSVGGWGYNDGHVVIVDSANGNYYGFWKLYVDSNGNPASTNVGKLVQGSLNGDGTPGTTATAITGLAGDILPGELDCLTCLNHALNIIVPGAMNSNRLCHQAPAMGTDGSVPGAIFCEGAKIRFDPSVDLSTLQASTAVKAIMRALQLYGGVITDQSGGGTISCYTDLATQPDMTGSKLIGQHLWIYY